MQNPTQEAVTAKAQANKHAKESQSVAESRRMAPQGGVAGTVHFGAKNQKRNSGANGGGEARRVKQRASSLAGGYDETAVQVAGLSASAGHCEVRWHLTVSVFLANCRR